MIKNLILDLGGVILDIDYQRTEEAFIALGITDFEEIYSQMRQSPIFDRLDTGKIDADEFLDSLAGHCKKPVSREQVRDAWNRMLIGLPAENLELLRELKPHFRLFLFSNTNAIHYPEFNELISRQHGIADFSGLFERAYYSHLARLRKPDEAAFNLVVRENNLAPQETLFIDDSPQHVEAARRTGISAVLKDKDESLRELLKRYLKWPAL
ncbi:MAG: HAD family phosphatase [Bacteroidia bacterium]